MLKPYLRFLVLIGTPLVEDVGVFVVVVGTPLVEDVGVFVVVLGTPLVEDGGVFGVVLGTLLVEDVGVFVVVLGTTLVEDVGVFVVVLGTLLVEDAGVVVETSLMECVLVGLTVVIASLHARVTPEPLDKKIKEKKTKKDLSLFVLSGHFWLGCRFKVRCNDAVSTNH
ncbi:hypothetical protein SNE40_013404 [Patella caerulea]|uniref:Uncharacterized protein n=1 Tax=Patella caerulea TaxID=87958 RepID=A0AAN8JEZ7_PATCE